jgi:NADH-quinone oxidoreductase subunit A
MIFYNKNMLNFINFFELNFFFNLIFLILISFMLGLLLFFVPIFFLYQDDYFDKISPYECGFNPFEETREPYDVQFYLVAVLFLLFDLEVSFLFPWALVFSSNSFFSLFILLYFLIILSLGFIFEWQRGALNWVKQ